MLFDSHAHVGVDAFEEDREAVIQRARAAGVVGWLEVGTDLAQSRVAIALAQQYEFVFATVGVHPSDIAGLTEKDWQQIEELLGHPKVVAVGEVGFDFYRGKDIGKQAEVLRRFLEIADTHSLPVVFHVRSSSNADGHAELLRLLRERKSAGHHTHGVVHTFSGTQDQANEYIT
ncbi:MAG: TatD family hydrolase, partial [Acidobacteriota bacterium]